MDGLLGSFSIWWLPMMQRGHVVWPELMTNLRGLMYMIWTRWVIGCNEYPDFGFFHISLCHNVAPVAARAHERNELFDLRFALAVAMTALVSFHLYSYGHSAGNSSHHYAEPNLERPNPYPVRHRFFLAILIAWFLPLVPNMLLSAASLAWWALPLPFLFGVIAMRFGAARSGTLAGMNWLERLCL